MREDFNLLDAFRTFDRGAKGYLLQREFSEGLESYEFFPPIQTVELFLRRYNPRRDARFRYSDFCEAFLPRKYDYSIMLVKRIPIRPKKSKRKGG